MSYSAHDLADLVREKLVEAGVEFHDAQDLRHLMQPGCDPEGDVGYTFAGTTFGPDVLPGPGNEAVADALCQYMSRVDTLILAANALLNASHIAPAREGLRKALEGLDK